MALKDGTPDTIAVRTCLAVALAVVATTLHGCYQTTVGLQYVCVKVDPDIKQCTAWNQTGALHPYVAACLPGDALLVTREGPRRMSDLRLGEEVLGYNHERGQPEFSAIRAWLHRSVGREVSMVDIHTESGVLTASPWHSVAVQHEGYAFAGDLQQGQHIIALNGSALINQVSATHTQDFYSPLTLTSNFYVNVGQSGASLLVHSFAHLQNPQQYDYAFHLILTVAELFVPSVHSLDYREKHYVHPVAHFLSWLFGFPLDNVNHPGFQGHDNEHKGESGKNLMQRGIRQLQV